MAGEPTLARGERGDWVNYLKQLLDYHEVSTEDRDDDLEDDDEYGRKTARAIRKFQRFHGLEATGQVDDETWRLLAEAPDPERRPPGAGDDEDDDNDDDDDDDYRERRRSRDESGGGRSRDRDDDDERGGGRSGSTRDGDKDDDKDKEEEPGTVGALLDSVASEFGIDMDWSKFGGEEEKAPKVELAGDPWIDRDSARSLNFRVKNSGTADASYYAVWGEVVNLDSGSQQMFQFDYQTSTNVATGEDMEESLDVEYFNRLSEDENCTLDEYSTYRLNVWIDGESNGSVDFELALEEASSDDGEDEDQEPKVRKVEHFRQP
jgi:peptidoglycan hydrolase-like protein with peptidoglycan-binding domain